MVVTEATTRAVLRHGYREDSFYPLALVNITNRCNLACQHCFVYRGANPNQRRARRRELPAAEILETVAALRDRHRISIMLWMGGEPLLRRDVLEPGVHLFSRNYVVTNGTLPLVDLGPDVLYIVSLDGPEDVNDAVRGTGTFRRVLRRLDELPAGFSTPVQAQCTVTRRNQGRLEELIHTLRDTRVAWMTFSFYVPAAGERSDLAWPTLDDRMEAVTEVMRLKTTYPEFVRNRRRSLELMAPDTAPEVTAACAVKRMLLPLYLEGDTFTTPFCCYGNDVDCGRCGAWVVFDIAARMAT